MAFNDAVRVGGQARLRRIDIPVPNKALASWLAGSECKAVVAEVTSEIYTIYRNSVPVDTGNLREHASWHVERGGWGAEQDRWFGWVTNDATADESAARRDARAGRRPRRVRPVPYAAYVEYGKPSIGRFVGQHQLRRAAEIVAGGLGSPAGVNVPGFTYAPSGRGSKLRDSSGRFARNPITRGSRGNN